MKRRPFTPIAIHSFAITLLLVCIILHNISQPLYRSQVKLICLLLSFDFKFVDGFVLVSFTIWPQNKIVKEKHVFETQIFTKYLKICMG